MDAPAKILRAARHGLGLSQQALAVQAGVSARTILKIEQEQHVKVETMRKVQAALHEMGVRFIDPRDGLGPGLHLPD